MAVFNTSTVHTCPHARASRGVARISVEVLQKLAYAVKREKDAEWLVFLLGERKENGLLVEVTDIHVPPEQQRYLSTVDFENVPIPDNCVGVLHSHCDYTAFFSKTDIEKFNTVFPLSIVIATAKRDSSAESRLLGFEYLAEGRFELPCGSLGVAQFEIEPMIEDWPFKKSLSRFDAERDGLGHFLIGDCDQHEFDVNRSDNYFYFLKAKCGLVDNVYRVEDATFGFDPSITEKLPAPVVVELPPPRGGAREALGKLAAAVAGNVDDDYQSLVDEITAAEYEAWWREAELYDDRADTQPLEPLYER